MKKIALTFMIVLMGVMLTNPIALAAEQRTEVDICCYSVGSIQYIWSAQHAKLINKYSKKIKATAAFCGAEAAVPASGYRDELVRNAGIRQCLVQLNSMAVRHQLIPVSVDTDDRWQTRTYVC